MHTFLYPFIHQELICKFNFVEISEMGKNNKIEEVNGTFLINKNKHVIILLDDNEFSLQFKEIITNSENCLNLKFTDEVSNKDVLVAFSSNNEEILVTFLHEKLTMKFN